jgi:hypothetical protein
MCVKIYPSESDMKDCGWMCGVGTASGYLMDQLIEFRNPQKDEKTEGEMFGRKVAAELGFALLAVASLVENVVRLALTLILFIPAVILGFCTECNSLIFDVILITHYLCGIVDQPLRCLVALVKNVTEKKFDYLDGLELCQLKDVSRCCD